MKTRALLRKRLKAIMLSVLWGFLAFTICLSEAAAHDWSQKLPEFERFQLVLDGWAVLDRETGLVWERTPDFALMPWREAISYCYNKGVGGRKGWRLPTVEELASLIDPTTSKPALPAGHPFSLQSNKYWSATTIIDPAAALSLKRAYLVDFSTGEVDDWYNKSSYEGVWCVRGGHGYDANW